MRQYNRGDTVLIEARVKKVVPFGSTDYADPTDGVFITIRDPDGNAVVDSASMDRSGVGLYYYLWQTTTDLKPGIYSCEIKVDDAQYDGLLRVQEIHLI